MTSDHLPDGGVADDGAELASAPGFVRGGAASFGSMLREAAQYGELRRTPYGLRPVLVLALISLAADFDSAIFPLATPDIIRDLNLNLVTLVNVVSFVSVLLSIGVVGIAFFADRTNRLRLMGSGAMLSGVASIGTSFARSIWSFGATRAGDAVAGTVLQTPVSSLMADYYPPETRGKAFALSGVLGRAAFLLAPATVAWLATATALKWRFPFLITGPLMIAGGLLALVALREPIRGYMERRALGASEAAASIPEAPVSFGEAWRTIWSIRTLRRLFMSEIPGGAGDGIFALFFGILLLQRYHLQIGGRAALSTVLGVALLPFGFLAGGTVDVLLRRRPQRVLIFTGGLTCAASVIIALIAFGPPLWLLVVVIIAFGAASAFVGPARRVLFAQVLPAHVRTLGVAQLALAAIPGALVRSALVGFVFVRWGVRGALLLSAVLLLIAGLLQISSAGFFERDMRAAISSQSAADEWRRAKRSGRGKLLVCRDVDVEYDGVQVLFGVDFDVDEGEIIALLGTNGAGKSTLLRAISGSQEASGGAVVFDGRDITHVPPHEVAGRGVVHMPGGRGVFPGLSVAENLLLATWTLDEADVRERAERVLDMFPILRERSGETAGTLSGGEQQMLSLAQAFLNRPRLLMIDELSLGLSPVVVAQLLEAVRAINEQGTTVIVVEQSVNVALSLAGRAIFMEKGEVKFVGATRDLLRRPDILRAVYVRGTGTLGAVRSRRREQELERAGFQLEVQEVSKSYGGVLALDGVTFSLREGEVLGLVGPNGAGKTTLFDVISGYQAPDRGAVRLADRDITALDPEQRARAGLVRRFQDARLFPPLTVLENILVALEMQLEVRSALMSAAQLPPARRAERRVRVRAERLIELFQLGAYRDKFVKELSTGLKRIVDVACVLAAQPRVLLLDEPSSGIAQAEAESLAPLLRRVRYETGCSILIIEHDMPLISSVADELLALDLGRVIVRGSPEQVLNDDRVVQSYLGGSESAIAGMGDRRPT